MLNATDVQEVTARFIQFANLPAEKKLTHFSLKAPSMCSDEWRTKLRQFMQEGSQASQSLMDEVFIHLQLDTLAGELVTSACVACRAAFWQMIWLSTDAGIH